MSTYNTNIIHFNYEGFDIKVYQTHELSLYIEDEYFGKLSYINYNFDKLSNIDSIFENTDKFWNLLNEKYYFYLFGNSYLREYLSKFFEDYLVLKLEKEFNNLYTKYNSYYEDNYRIAIVGNKEQEEEYERLRKKGCCGFVDEIIEIDNIKYKFGFNYGH